jgi:cytoskeletal protein RodZ
VPPAIIPALIAGVVGIGTMINGNVQQKAAIKNNETQQASAVGNAQQATANAQKQLATYNAANPAPTQAPTAAPATMGAPAQAAPAPGNGNTQGNSPLIGAIMNAAQTGSSLPSGGSAAVPLATPGGGATTSGTSTANLIAKILGSAAA